MSGNGSPRPLSVIAAHSGLGAGNHGTGAAPQSLSVAGLRQWIVQSGRDCDWHDIVQTSGPAADRVDRVALIALDVNTTVQLAVQAGRQFLVIGGDHSIAIGSWSGVANALGPGRRPGLVWLDAHLDSHIPETSPSGNWHGMPVAHLLGAGHPKLVGLAAQPPALDARSLALVGARSFEPAEPLFLAQAGVRQFPMTEIRSRGLDQCFADALDIARRSAHFGVSIDLDVVDPVEAPGVGSPVPGGITADEIVAILSGLARTDGFAGLEIVEFNPSRDVGDRTLDLVRRIVQSAFG